jgi:hypothetical protein
MKKKLIPVLNLMSRLLNSLIAGIVLPGSISTKPAPLRNPRRILTATTLDYLVVAANIAKTAVAPRYNFNYALSTVMLTFSQTTVHSTTNVPRPSVAGFAPWTLHGGSNGKVARRSNPVLDSDELTPLIACSDRRLGRAN